jgi:hypothetical protein
MIAVAALFIIAAFLSWWGSWFGRSLSDGQTEEYLHDREKPRNVQHALYQIGERIIKGDQSVRRWYPSIIEASRHEVPQVRLWAAWVMGQDKTAEQFHTALLPMLGDWHAGVRHNAALALVRFNDESARSELRQMLQSRTLRAEEAGTVELIMKEEGVPVGAGAPLLRIKHDDGRVTEVHAQEEGRVESLAVADGARVESGSELMTLSPAIEQVWETLRAFYCIGRPDDAEFIQRFTRPGPGMPDHIQKQAAATLEAIRNGGLRCS